MRLREWIARAGVLSLACVTHGATASAPSDLRIYADAEVRITYDGSDVGHMEAPIAASTTDPNRLVVAAELMMPGRALLEAPTHLYWTDDGGAKWQAALPLEIGAWDNAMTAGPDGRLYFITHNYVRGLMAYSSTDGGKTWTGADVPGLRHGTADSQGWDREYAVVDNSPNSPYRGRLYIQGEGSPRAGAGTAQIVVGSSDGAATFSAPAVACDPSTWAPRYRKLKRRVTEPPGPAKDAEVESVQAPVVLSDGTLVVGCHVYPPIDDFGVVTSRDGGRTFSEYRKIGSRWRSIDLYDHAEQIIPDGDPLALGVPGPALAVGPPTGTHVDRLYSAWPSLDSQDITAVYFAYSDDRGKSWSVPHALDIEARNPAGEVRQAGPMLAVNKDGVVGLAWFDARNSQADGYDIYFAASVDGGEHFLPAVRLTSRTSYPTHGASGAAGVYGLNAPTYDASTEPTHTTATFMSPYVARRTGGDQSTLVADAAGRFHALWSDAREGAAWQLYTRVVRVAPVVSAQTSTQCVLDRQLRVLFGSESWDPARGEISIPIRLQNISGETLTSPVHLDVGAGRIEGSPKLVAWYASLAPFVVASAGKSADRVRIEVPVSPERPLFPQSVTEEFTMKLSVSEPAKMYFSKVFSLTSAAGSCAP